MPMSFRIWIMTCYAAELKSRDFDDMNDDDFCNATKAYLISSFRENVFCRLIAAPILGWR